MAQKALKEVLRLIAEKFGVQELEHLAASSSVQELNIEEETFTKVKDGLSELMTVDEAIKVPAVVDVIKKDLLPKQKKRILLDLEKSQEEFVKKNLGEEKLAELKKSDSAMERQSLIDQWLEEELQSKDKNKGNNDQLVEKYNKILNDFNTKQKEFEEFKSQAEQEKQQIHHGWEQKLVRKEALRQAQQYKWLDHFDDKAKRLLIEDLLNDVSTKANLKLSDSNDLLMFDKENPDLEYHEGTKKLNFKDYLEQNLSPYLKKSDPKEEHQTKLRQDQNPFKAKVPAEGTLARERWELAQQQKQMQA